MGSVANIGIGVDVVNPTLSTSSVRTVGLAVTGGPGAYVATLGVTDPRTGMVSIITHLLDCDNLRDVESQIQTYCAASL